MEQSSRPPRPREVEHAPRSRGRSAAIGTRSSAARGEPCFARLPARFYRRDARVVARALIGCVLVHRGRSGVIVETEAYLGPEDRASHARFGETARTAVMFGPGGVAYVYLCYGMHWLFNVVTGPAGHPQAVLVRAVAPYVGLPADPAVGRGPGKVATALRIDRRHDRRDLARGALFIAARLTTSPPPILAGPRIGVSYAGDSADLPLRFWWRDHPAVSRDRASRPDASTVATRRRR
jgi:DNA-3-methyladenine glycosylase